MGFINYSINGVGPGSVYAIIVLGYTAVYGIIKMLNFAHGDVTMIGSYVVLVTVSTMEPPPMVGVPVAVLACTLLGMIIERTAYKPLRGASSLAVLITVIGVSYSLQNVASFIFGADTKPFTSAVTIPTIKLAGERMTITGETIIATLSCIVIVIGLTTFINKSKVGQAMLVVLEDRGAATPTGISVNGTIILTFAIGFALAAIADVLLRSAYLSLAPYTGSMSGIKAFVAVMFGGIGSIPGTSIGGILLGVVEILAKAYISSQMSDTIVLYVLTIVLLVKPTGILGKKIDKKVQVSV